MTITDDKAFFLPTVIARHFIIFIFVGLLLVKIFAILFGPLVLRIHIIVNQIFIAPERVPRSYYVTLLIKGALEIFEAIFDDDALASFRQIHLLDKCRACVLLLRPI